MTPMNDNVRKEFKKLNGFDPLEIFKQGSQYFWKTNPAAWQKFVDYRKDLCFRQKKYVLDLMAGVREKKKDFELMLTVIDVTMEPGLADYISEDTAKLFSLQKKYDLTLQIEDPSLFWSGKPERYDTLGEYYKKYVKDISKLVLDCNVMDNHKKGFGGLPSEKPTGAEIRQITYNMDITGSRPAFYSEATLFENDYRNIGSILARDTVLTEENEAQWRVKTPYTVYVRTGKKDLLTKLDGEIWFAGEGDNVMVPAGEHVLSFESEQRYFDLASLKPKLLYLSGELKWANFLNNSVEFSYDSNFVPCYAIFNKRPAKIIVDSKKLSCQILEKDGGFSVKLPAGDHIARIMVGAGVSSLIEKSGVILLSLIIIFGFFTSVIFLGLFMIIQLKRKFAP